MHQLDDNFLECGKSLYTYKVASCPLKKDRNVWPFRHTMRSFTRITHTHTYTFLLAIIPNNVTNILKKKRKDDAPKIMYVMHMRFVCVRFECVWVGNCNKGQRTRSASHRVNSNPLNLFRTKAKNALRSSGGRLFSRYLNSFIKSGNLLLSGPVAASPGYLHDDDDDVCCPRILRIYITSVKGHTQHTHRNNSRNERFKHVLNIHGWCVAAEGGRDVGCPIGGPCHQCP